jgi:hypothetical protein
LYQHFILQQHEYQHPNDVIGPKLMKEVDPSGCEPRIEDWCGIEIDLEVIAAIDGDDKGAEEVRQMDLCGALGPGDIDF